ncbi:MAG: hypothetical protein NC548_45680 [Lachnospiraceae bacterium]|nr:hypothetical protein [Lachnospiraceae bacterium]
MHHLQDKIIRNKIIATNLKKYGCANPGSNLEVNNRRIATNLDRYGVKNPMQNQLIAQKSCKNRMHISRCIFPENLKSKAIQKWLKVSQSPITTLLPNTLVKRTAVPSESCMMLMLYKRTASIFMNKYHPYGWDNRGQLCLGWVYHGKLIQLITFGKAKDPSYKYQIYQVCSHPEYLVIDGIQKLYNHATAYFEIEDAVLYEDTAFTTIGKELNMHLVSLLPPIKMWRYQDIVLPDDQIFNRDLTKLFGIIDGTKDEMLQDHGWKIEYLEDFCIFSTTTK